MTTLIVTYFQLGALLLICSVGWYGYRVTRHYSVGDVQNAIGGKKKIVDPKVTAQLSNDAKLCRRVMGWWFVSFIVLVIAVSAYNTAHHT